MSESELTPEARSLLDAAKREISPTKADRDRVRKAIAVAAGGAAAVAAGSAIASTGSGAGAGIGAGASATTVGGISLAVKVGIAITIVAAAATGTTVMVKMSSAPSAPAVAAHVQRAAHAEHVAAQPAEAPRPVTGTEAPPVAVPAALPNAPSLPVAPPHARVALAPPPPGAMPEPVELSDTINQEQLLLRQAFAAIDRHDAVTADARLEELDTLNPRTQFSEETAVARILISCESHDVDRARAAADRFHAQYPMSSAARKLHGSCVDP